MVLSYPQACVSLRFFSCTSPTTSRRRDFQAEIADWDLFMMSSKDPRKQEKQDKYDTLFLTGTVLEGKTKA